MINTIFYFVPTLLEYQAKLNSGEIASRTIVFVADNRSIYKGGIRYGGYNSSELNDVIDSKLNPVITTIQNALQLIEDLNHDIDNVVTDKQTEITGVINDTLSEYKWLKKNLGDVFAYQGFVDLLNSFLTTVGVLKSTDSAWTSIVQTVDSITGNVNQIKDGTLIKSMIQGWIKDDISHIDLSTYALKTDLNDYLLSNNLNSELTGTTAFVNLQSSINDAVAMLGTFSQEQQQEGNTIVQLIGLLRTDVDTLSNSVTTSLSSTISTYLGNDLTDAVNSYLTNQAGLMLSGDLDRSVAELFSRSGASNTKTDAGNFIDGKINTALTTAGFVAISDFGSAVATQYATSNDLYAALTTEISNDSSFITAVALSITINGDDIHIDATHQLDLSGQIITANNLNVINNNKKVAYINDDGHASFIGGHIYMPYLVQNWWTNEEDPIVGLYIDSIPAGSTDLQVASSTAYVQSHYAGIFSPRTLFEPHGFRVEDGSKHVMSSVYTVPFIEQGSMTSYSTRVSVYDTEDAECSADIILTPNIVRLGHDSHGGICEIINNSAGFNENDPYTWKGKFHVHKWHSAEIEVGDEIHLIAHGSPRVNPEHNEYNESDPLYNGTATGIHVSGNVRIDHASVFESTALLFVPSTNQGSDERMKTIIDNIEPSIEDIAGVRIVDFTFNNDDTNDVHAGTIAQDWQNIVPNAVKPHTYIGTQEEYLTLDYSAVSVVSAVTAAKEIVKLKQENAELKERLAAIEARLAQL